MTVARVLDTGSGALAFSARIEGDSYEWCNSMDLAGTATAAGFTRIGGLIADAEHPIRFSETPDVIEGRLKCSPLTLQITGPEARETFARRPSVRTYLTLDLPASLAATTMTVMSTAGITAGMHLTVNKECVLVDNVIDATQITVTRAQRDTYLQKHWADTSLPGLRRPLVTDRPFVRRGRRVRIYWAADADVAAGTMTQFWIGVLKSDPRREDDGLTWRLDIDPLSTLLDTDLGSDMTEEMSATGIVYNNSNRLNVIITQLVGADSDDPRDGAVPELIVRVGSSAADPNDAEFFPTQDAFLAELNSRIQTAAGSWTGWSGRVRAVPTPGGGWGFDITQDAANFIRVVALSPVDGATEITRLYNQSTDTYVSAVTAGTSYSVPWLDSPERGLRQVPRGSVGIHPGDVGRPMAGSNLRWIGLTGLVDITGLTTLKIEWPDGESRIYTVLETDVPNRLVRIDHGEGGRYDPFHMYVGESPRVNAMRVYATASNLYGFLSALTTLTPDYANRGSVPGLYAADLNLTEIQATVEECAADSAWASTRLYRQAGPIKLSDIISQECKLLGCFLCLDSLGRLTLRPLRLRTPTDLATATLSGPDPDIATPNGEILDDRGIPQWEPHAMGLVNAVEVYDGFNPRDRSYFFGPFRILNAQAFGETQETRLLEIKPYSIFGGGLLRSEFIEQAATLAERVFGMFSSEYAILTPEVALNRFSLLCGDTVRVSHDQIPNPDTGAEGVTDLQTIVLGREWDPYNASGSLTLFWTGQRIAGYAPSFRVSSSVNVGGNKWDLTIDLTKFLASGDSLANHVKVGERMRVVRFDNATPGIVAGTIADVVSPVITINLDGAWTPGADTWDVETVPATDASLATRQKDYAFEANSAGRINFASGAEPARTFAAG